MVAVSAIQRYWGNHFSVWLHMQDLILCITVLYCSLGNILTPELLHSSTFPFSERAFMYSGEYAALNEMNLTAASVTAAGLNFWLPFPPFYFFLFQMFMEQIEVASICSQGSLSKLEQKSYSSSCFSKFGLFQGSFHSKAALKSELSLFSFFDGCTCFHAFLHSFVSSYFHYFALRNLLVCFPL